MKCSKCNIGELRVKYSRMSVRTGYFNRSRVCNSCGYKVSTIEISRDEFARDIRMISDLKRILFATQKE